MSFSCNDCNVQFSTYKNYIRHKNRSCRFNPNRIPRIYKSTAKTTNLQQKKMPAILSPSANMNLPVDRKPTSIEPTIILPVELSEKVGQIVQQKLISKLGDFIPSNNISDPQRPTLEMLFQKQQLMEQKQDLMIQKLFEGNKQTLKDNNSSELANNSSNSGISSDFENRMFAKIDSLKKTFESTNKSVYNSNTFNIEKIQIYITDNNVDFVDVMTKRMGSRKQAVDYIKSKIRQKIDGDVELFCDIYLNGTPDTWSISCPDAKHKVFRIAQPDSKVINDPGGVQIHKNFRNIYSNTLLRLNNRAIFDTISKIPGTPEYEQSRDELLDSFELGMIQEKAQELCKAPSDPFIKKLAVKFKSLEKSYELLSTGS